MKFKLESIKEVKPEIKIGDMFINKMDDENEDSLFILVSLTDTTNGHSYLGMNYPVQLLSMSGEGIYQSFKSLEDAKDHIEEFISDEEFEHISQDRYELSLIRKE